MRTTSTVGNNDPCRLREAQREFDCRFFLLGVFLLLFALGPGEEPRGDAWARLVITKQLLTQGKTVPFDRP